MAVKGSRKNGGKKLVQSRLQIGPKSHLTKCTKCGMTYSPSVIDDTTTHKNYHEMHLKGKKWPSTWGSGILLKSFNDSTSLTPPSSSSKMGISNSKDERIVMVRCDHQTEVRTTIHILDIVNSELHAPHNENEFWCQPNSNGKAFLYVKDDRAVGVLTVELLKPERCRWMVYEDSSIVEGVEPRFILGISRIWVCRTQRNKGIATKLLEAARSNTIYGKTIEKWAMAWSQPTDSGGKLASHYNGVRHKSGKLLIPCYI
ncbi:hypothetical protein ZYGR_0AV00250 [Zygosaccharomyces rouxii]|uniref:N-acetyltransferase ECO1 n=1 Tax=Zygosaccharomyces rouxii TaxID=4956 RepID=A0A1Q3AI40_ZYGRO|nr:hypothetical protein ZYGR_0AV00250 [Zygosaccharomyces rouxii]